jgi:general secretion pathway protein C
VNTGMVNTGMVNNGMPSLVAPGGWTGHGSPLQSNARSSDPSGARASGLVRPAVEAALVAAVAFGCAQVGWAVLAPPSADATGTPDMGARSESAPTADAPILSPFAPMASAADVGSQAVSAELATLTLAGVRASLDPTRSSAIFTLADGGQRAFRVGDDVVAGVRLTEVSGGAATLSFAGGERTFALAPRRDASFAQALLARVEAPAGVSMRAWFARLLAQGPSASGWRLGEDLPAPAKALGLKPGDQITAVNGVDAARAAEAMAAAAHADSVTVTILREGQSRSLSLGLMGRTQP